MYRGRNVAGVDSFMTNCSGNSCRYTIMLSLVPFTVSLAIITISTQRRALHPSPHFPDYGIVCRSAADFSLLF
jgi:hypothetical protein